MNNRNAPPLLLALVHVIGLRFAYWLAGDDFGRKCALAGIEVSQMVLLGLWGALSRCSWQKRLACVLVGVAYLLLLEVLLNPVPMNRALVLHYVVLYAMSLLPLIATAAFFLLLRRLGIHLAHIGDDNPSQTTPKFQFSIRHLFLFTLLIACTLGATPWLLDLLWESTEWFEPFSEWCEIDRAVLANAPVALAFFVGVFRECLWSVPVAAMAVWAVLGRRHSVVRSIVVFVACWPLAHVLAANVYGSAPMFPASTWTVAMIPEAFSVILSLWVVRLAGFRVVRVRPTVAA